MKRTCSMPKCRRVVRANRLCNMHNLRRARHGDPAVRLKAANGEGSTSNQGYRIVTIGGRRLTENRVTAERALGHALPPGAETAAIAGALVISPGTAYTKLLHTRLKALEATGDTEKRQCRYCNAWDDRANLYMKPHLQKGEHGPCRQKARRKLKLRKLARLMKPAREGNALRWAA